MPIGRSVQVQYMSLTKQFLPVHFYSNPTDKNLKILALIGSYVKGS